MSLKSYLSIPISQFIVSRQNKSMKNAIYLQKKIMKKLVKKSDKTLFGLDHDFSKIKNYQNFKENIPIREYEDFKYYIEKILNNEKNILCPGTPKYFAKTSGTTSGTKYIPITRQSIPNHIFSANQMLLNYIYEKKSGEFLNGHYLFLSGSPELTKKGNIFSGRLSGIVNHHIPFWIKKNYLPSFSTNCIPEWEKKIERIVKETEKKNITIIGGIPPWIQMYFDLLIKKTGKKIKDVFPNLKLLCHGGVNFKPYKDILFDSIGKKIDTLETYPASEGFFAFQNISYEDGLLLQINSGIFYEFIPLEEYHKKNRTRISLKDVELNKNYALIINSNAGLWGYSIGDTIKFVSLNPYKIIVTGRVKHFLSAFGEHVISNEIETAITKTCKKFKEVKITEFTVAPSINSKSSFSCHEWYIEFKEEPRKLEEFEKILDNQLCKLNLYYKDLIYGKILKKLKIKKLKKDSFINYMKSINKLGGQNKVPRLSNDRKIVEKLEQYLN